MFVDIHCHLEMCKNPEEVIEKAREKNVLIVGAGVDRESNEKVLGFSESNENVRACLGLYPIEALMLSDKGVDSELAFIRENKNKIIGIGEVGIDLQESDNFAKQKENFIKIIKLGKELDLPIVVHSRKAEEKVIEILENEMAKKVVMHCFSGSIKLVKRIIENGWYLSVPGMACYGEQFMNLVLEAPIGSLLCETDSPYLHPERKRDNTPENVIMIYEKIAELKKLSLADVEAKVEENFERVFG